ncbi:MAG: TetR/AcrR family transcriptional regulator [Polyangiales bacterium]
MPRKRDTSSPPRIRRSPEEARRLILDAAVRVLSEHGPAAVGLKDVARAAGVSHALITHYFGTYEALVEASVEQALATVRERLLERLHASQAPTPEAMIALYLEIALEPGHSRLLTWALFTNHASTAERAARLVTDMKRIVSATDEMLRGRRSPPATRRQVETLIVGVWSLVTGYIVVGDFCWRALGHKPGPARDKDLREGLLNLTRILFDEPGRASSRARR